MKKKILSLFLALTLCLSLLPTAAFAADGAQDPEQEGGPAGVSAPQTGAANSEFTVQAAESGHSPYHTTICNTYPCTDHKTLTWSAISNVNQLKSATDETKGYYLATDLELTEPWVPTGTVNLCLNGHSITLNAGTDAAPQSTIEVTSGVQLNIADCKAIVPGSESDGVYYGGPYVRHADGSVGPGITVLNGGTVELFGGKITQNSDGVVVQDGGTLNMPSNSDVSKNTGAGVRVEAGGTLNMSGGYISSNEGCGVDVASGSNFTVSGGTKILSNTENDEPCNVYLHNGATMKVSGLSTARIGVTAAALPADGGYVPVTSDGSASRSDQNCITSDDTSYRVVYSTTNSPNNLVLNARPTPLHADHNKTTFVNSLSSSDGKLLINGEEAETNNDTGTTYYILPEGNYYLEGDLALNRGLLAYSADVVLCLNGHNITVAGTSYVIYTAKKTSSASGSYTFTLTDCADEPGTLTHSNGQGGGVYVRGGTFIMRGGKISGNSYGVNVTQGNEFKIYGGEISGNNNYGVKLTPVSGAYSGNGYIHMTVGGTARITGNWENGTYNAENHLYEQGTGTAKNVYFTDKPYKYITVDSTLTDGAEIGVTIWKPLTGERDYVAVATCGTSSSANTAEPYKGYFKSDSDAYKVWSSNNNVVIGVWNSEDQIHPVCGKVCSHKDTDGKPLHQDIVWTPVSSASGLNNGDNIYLTDDIELTKTWQISADGTVVNLCLNGHTIKANGNFDTITLTSNTTTLNICDCSESGSGKITHGTKGDGTTYSGAGVYMTAAGSRKATVNMYGGTITGNTGHTVEIKGTTSTRGGGVYVDSNAQFSMRGGSITGNTADVGGGVYYTASNSLFVSGKVNITGNKNTSGADSNVYVLPSSGTPKTVPFYIGAEGLDEEAKIGVWAVIDRGTYSPVAQLAPYADKANAYHKGNFILDNGGDYGFKLENSEYSTLSSTVVNLYNGVHKHPICGETCTDGAHTGNGKSLTWKGISSLSDIDKDGNYYLTGDVELPSVWTCQYNVNLCLNGYSIKAEHSSNIITVAQGKTFTLTDCNSSNGSKHFKKDASFGRWVQDDNGTITVKGGTVFHPSKGGLGVDVAKDSTFTMYGGTICGNSGASGGGVRVFSGGTFHMYGGTICGNSGSYGGGVYVEGTFNMSGRAAITGNTVTYSGGGVYVDQNGTFNMSGGAAITGNGITQSNGGGVYVDRSTAKVNVSGDVKIENNWKGGTLNADTGVYEQGNSGSANNLCLNADKTVTIDDSNGLSSNAHIGVTTQNAPTGSNQIKIATGATKELSYYTNIFTPDVTDYTVTKDGTTLYLSAHEHHWKYERAASGEEIMVSCDADGCDLNGQKIYYTLRAPATSTLTYDGNGKPARVIVTGAPANVTTPQPSAISYMQTQPTQLTLENGAEPTNAGTYYASVTVGTETATVKYTIAPARLLITAKSTVIDYGSEPVNDGVDYQGFVNGETESVLIGELEFEHEYTQYGKVGDYDITPKGLTSRNYDITFLPGKLQVKPRPIIVTVNEVSREYGAANPELAYTASRPVAAEQAVVNGDDLGLTLSTTATAASPVDDYDVTCNTDYNSNYSITFDGTGKLKVTPKKITVTADNKSSRVGQPIVPLTYTYTPELIGSDEFNGELATNANKDTAGTYDITQDTLTLGDNYNIDFVSGTYTVQDKMPQDDFKFADVVGGKVTKTYGDPDFKFEATGQVADSKEVLYFSSAPEVATVRSDGTVHILKVSTTPITITATASATDDYAQGVATYELTVSPKELKATDLVATGSLTKTYDGTTTATGITVSVKDGVLVNGDQQPTITGSAKYNSKDVATANTITFTPNAITEGNYRLAATETVTITGAKINRRTITIRSVQVQPKQYDGDANGWSCITGVTFDGLVGSETLTKSTDYGITEATFNSANVNEANKITGKVGIINPNLNYIFKNADGTETGNASFEQACTITPRNSWALTPVNDLTIRYNNRDPQTYTPNWSTLLPSGQTWTYNSDNTVCTGSANLSTNTIGADTGVLGYQLSDGAENDTVTWTITASCGNYQTFTLTVTLTLIARDPQTNFKFENNTTSVTKTYGDGDFTIKATGEETGSNVTYTSDDETVAKVDKDGKVTIVGAGTATIKAKASETADFDEKVISYTLTVKKLRIHVPTPGKNELVYTGEEQTYMPDGLNTTYCEISRNKAKDVIDGDNWKTADVTLRDPRNTEWDEGVNNTTPKEYRFRITPKPITVKALDKKITTGQSAPALTNAKLGEDYTITGLIGSDSLGSIVLYYADPANTAATVMPDTGKVGTYAIVAKLGGGTRNPNYAPMFVSGTLTIANRPSSGGGAVTYPVSIPDKVENGSVSSDVKNASKGSTVTITIKPEDGFKLANLTVIDKDGNKLEIADKGDGKYTFIMPAGKVEVKASFTKEVETSPFADVATDAYYYEAVKWAAEQGITGGTGSGLFSPDYTCTRAQIVTFLWRAAGSPEPKAMSGFSDVPENSYYAKAVAWAVENGITVGTSSTTFSPEATCTRAQSVTFLFRAAKASADGTPAFSDVTANAYYAEAVKWATDNGITNGIGGGLFGSNNDCTRAQIVTFLWRLYAGK